MSVFKKKKNKDKDEIVTAKNDVSMLDKILPNNLFLGHQRDINKKALKSYLHSVAQTSFENYSNAKYSIKKIAKNEYIYEFHDGTSSLTYIPLVYKELFLNNKDYIILKTNTNNVKVTKKSTGKIETNVLLSHNTMEDEALIDYESKGNLVNFVKKNLSILIFSSFLFLITGAITVGFEYIRYTKLNEDYSYSYVRDNSLSPIQYVESLNFKDHSPYKYIKKIEFIKGSWSVQYGFIEKEEVDDNIPSQSDLNNVVEMPVMSEIKKEIKDIDNNINDLNKDINNVNKDINKKIKKDIEKNHDIVISKVKTTKIKETKNKSDDIEIIDIDNAINLDVGNLPKNIIIEKGVK